MSQPDYNVPSRLLHRAALHYRFMGRAAFDLEQARAGRGADTRIANPVFIAGLARSGSTILLNALHRTGVFRSLTYRDMPFVLMSGTWRKLTAGSRRHREATERAHGDGLSVDFDSPEAFEEIFWKTFCGESYILEHSLVPHDPSPAVIKDFQRFVAHVVASRDQDQQRRYLSKNNNNLLRLPSLKQAFPDALIIIPFRDPLQQARSLLRQHQLFSQRQAADRFSLQYMNWLGHYEFGLGRRHYAYSKVENPFDAMDIDYWLRCWHDAYEYAVKTAPADAIYLSYERLCADPLHRFRELMSRLQLEGKDADAAAALYRRSGPEREKSPPGGLADDCEHLYAELVEKSTRRFPNGWGEL